MAVSLIISTTINGVQVADTLAGGGTGYDLGPTTNGSYSNVVDQNLNTGSGNLYVRHDGVVDPITDTKFFIAEYSQTYGGPPSSSPTDDFNTLVSLGQTSGTSKNNADGNSGGLWIDQDFDASSVNQFDIGNFPAVVNIFGQGDQGIDVDSAYPLKADALTYDNAGEQQPSAPEDGKIGISGDTVLGDNAKIKFRLYLPQTFPDGGIHQWDWTISYAFTA